MLYLLMNILDPSKYQDLHPILSQEVTRAQIEFFPGSIKPHVVLRLFLRNEVQIYVRGQSKTIGSCMLDPSNDQSEGRESGVVLRVQPGHPIHPHSLIGFVYPALQSRTVEQYISAIHGTLEGLPSGHSSNLSLFYLTYIHPSSESAGVDGCRDAVTQWVIRLNEAGFIGWIADDIITAGHLQFDPPRREFDKFIAKGYNDVGGNLARRSGARRGAIEVTEHDIPMHPGSFSDPYFRRVKEYRGSTLPYI